MIPNHSRLGLLRRGSACLLFCFWASGLFTLATARELQIHGREYIDLVSVAQRFGMKSYWLGQSDNYRLKSAWTTLDFEADNRQARINGVPIYLGQKAELSSAALFIWKQDLRSAIEPVLIPHVFRPVPSLRRIVLDAGHGGRDEGAKSATADLLEKSLTLDVTLRLKGILEAKGYEVYLSRNSDRYIELKDRAAFANKVKADLFLSIHFNSARSPEAEGVECFVLTPQFQQSTHASSSSSRDRIGYSGNRTDAWNTLFGYHLIHQMGLDVSGQNRGLKRARFAVLKDLHCPGALVELGFLSHAESADRFAQPAYRDMLAQSLSKGIDAYANRLSNIE